MGFAFRLCARVFAEVRDPIRVLFALGVVAIAAAYDWLRINVATFLPELSLSAIALGALAIIFAGVAVSFASKVLQQEDTQPRLYLFKTVIELSPMDVLHTVTGQTAKAIANVVSVLVKNNPIVRSEAGAVRDAHAEIEFIDPDSLLVLRTLSFARWADNPQPGHAGAPATVDPIRYRTLLPNDAQHRLNIALIFPGAPTYLFAFNNDVWVDSTIDAGAMPFPTDSRLLIRGVIKSSTAPDFHFEFFVRRLDPLRLRIEDGPSFAHWLG